MTERASMNDPVLADRVRRLLWLEESQSTSSNSGEEFSDDAESESFIAPIDPMAVPNYPGQTCPICMDSVGLYPSPCCSFACCTPCWHLHISTAVNDGRVKVPCASNDCKKYLPKEFILNYIGADSQLHERFIKLYLIANQNPRSKTCPHCSHLYSLDASEHKKIPKEVQCSECALVWCFRCQAPWHKALTCKQFVKGDRLLVKWMNQKDDEQWNARKCPKCGSFIQRNGGCPHMTCGSCSCDFCYLCGRRYIKIPILGQHGNKYSLFGCPYNLHANRPWLRRTVRGAIATSIVVASPVLVVGVVTAAAVVLPPVGIYRLARHLKARRERRNAVNMGRVRLSVALEDNDLLHRVVPRADVRRERELLLRARTRRMEEEQDDVQEDATDNDSNLAIFGDLDVTHLFLETGTEDDQESKPSVIERARMEESLSTTSYADDFFRRSSTTVE